MAHRECQRLVADGRMKNERICITTLQFVKHRTRSGRQDLLNPGIDTSTLQTRPSNKTDSVYSLRSLDTESFVRATNRVPTPQWQGWINDGLRSRTRHTVRTLHCCNFKFGLTFGAHRTYAIKVGSRLASRDTKSSSS